MFYALTISFRSLFRPIICLTKCIHALNLGYVLCHLLYLDYKYLRQETI